MVWFLCETNRKIADDVYCEIRAVFGLLMLGFSGVVCPLKIMRLFSTYIWRETTSSKVKMSLFDMHNNITVKNGVNNIHTIIT